MNLTDEAPLGSYPVILVGEDTRNPPWTFSWGSNWWALSRPEAGGVVFIHEMESGCDGDDIREAKKRYPEWKGQP